MDSYIVRIYRRTDAPTEFAGQVEKAGTETKEIFHNSAELVRILTSGCEFVRERRSGTSIAAK